MKKSFFILSALLLASATVSAQPDAEEILRKSHEKLSKEKNISYTGAMLFKFFNQDTAYHFRGNVWLQRAPKDTNYGGKIFFATDDTSYKLYDLKKFFIVNSKEKKVEILQPAKGEQYSGLDNRMILNDFLEPERIANRINGKNKIFLGSDSVIKGLETWRVIVQLPNDNEYTDMQWTFFINKEDFVPILTKSKIKFLGDYQLADLGLDKYSFEKIPEKKFSAKQIPPSYQKENLADKFARNEKKPLANGTAAPPIPGKFYQENLRPDSVVFAGKITVLDFWYMSCYWCMKAIPEMEKIAKKYEGKNVQIIGVNSMDNNEKELKRMPKFLQYKPISYKILLVEKEIPENYHIDGWPEFYVVDQSGNIAYSSAGYNSNLEEEISVVIDRLLAGAQADQK